MHELAITESILKIAIDEANKHNAKKVLSIKIRLGEFSGIVPKLIQDYYDIVSQGTCAEKSKLDIQRVPVRFKCSVCQEVTEVKKVRFKCPKCGSTDIKMISGREFYIESMEVE